MHPSGVGRRFAALLIDGMAIAVIQIGALIIALIAIGVQDQDNVPPNVVAFITGSLFLSNCIGVPLLCAWFEASEWQATPGKRLLSICVADVGGGRVTIGQAIGRNFAKTYLSGILLIGYILAFFSNNKQSLHDMIANTLVVTGGRDETNALPYIAPTAISPTSVLPSTPPPTERSNSVWVLAGFDYTGTHVQMRFNDHDLRTGGSIIIGRDSSLCQMVIGDETASRRHARLVYSSGQLCIEDLNSANGTMVDGNPVSQTAVPVRASTNITLGGASLRLSRG